MSRPPPLGFAVALAVLFTASVAVPGPAPAQSQPAAPSAGAEPGVLTLAAVPLGAGTAAAVAGSVLDDGTDDPIDDRSPSERVAAFFGGLWTWVSYTAGSAFYAVTPPTPSSMIKGLRDDDEKSPFFALIGDAGYKIKEIENGVGLPPDVTVKFGRIRNLSEADLDYIDRELSRWSRRDAGVVADAQRAVITTLVAINQSDSYVVDGVRMRLLPLPQVKFTLAPTVGGLGWESSQLMRAIQRLDRRVADIQKKG